MNETHENNRLNVYCDYDIIKKSPFAIYLKMASRRYIFEAELPGDVDLEAVITKNPDIIIKQVSCFAFDAKVPGDNPRLEAAGDDVSLDFNQVEMGPCFTPFPSNHWRMTHEDHFHIDGPGIEPRSGCPGASGRV